MNMAPKVPRTPKCMVFMPLVLHKVVAEVSKIGPYVKVINCRRGELL
jgi:hypothetical protein